MSSESSQKSTKALTTLLGLFLVCIFSENVVSGRAVQKAPTIKVVEKTTPPFKEDTSDQSKYNLPRSQVISSDLISSAAADVVITSEVNGNPQHQNQIRMSSLLGNTIIANSDNQFTKLTRSKRSPYPPGFVAWTWREPCYCPPGQYLSCRCRYSNKMAGLNSSSSEEESNRKRRRSRSKKLKFKL